MGDFNSTANNRCCQTQRRYGLGERNDKGMQSLQFCAINDLAISNTYYPHPTKRRVTCISPNGKNMNQIDNILIQNKSRHMVKNSRAYNSAEIGSDNSPCWPIFNSNSKTPDKQKQCQYDTTWKNSREETT